MRNFLIAASLFGLLLISVVAGIIGWTDLGTVEISAIGWFAMIGGVLLSLAVGGGLMALVFYSARSGHDEKAQRRRVAEEEQD